MSRVLMSKVSSSSFAIFLLATAGAASMFPGSVSWAGQPQDSEKAACELHFKDMRKDYAKLRGEVWGQLKGLLKRQTDAIAELNRNITPEEMAKIEKLERVAKRWIKGGATGYAGFYSKQGDLGTIENKMIDVIRGKYDGIRSGFAETHCTLEGMILGAGCFEDWSRMLYDGLDSEGRLVIMACTTVNRGAKPVACTNLHVALGAEEGTSMDSAFDLADSEMPSDYYRNTPDYRLEEAGYVRRHTEKEVPECLPYLGKPKQNGNAVAAADQASASDQPGVKQGVALMFSIGQSDAAPRASAAQVR